MPVTDPLHESTPFMGLSLTLHPHQLEKEFWRSNTYKAAAKYIDAWHFYVTVAANAMYLRHHARVLFKAVRGVVVCACYLAAAIAQLIYSKKCPNEYYRFRGHIYVALRTVRLCSFIRTPLHIRKMIASGSAMQQLVATVGGSTDLLKPLPMLTLAKHLMRASATAIATIHSLNMPLPFRKQLLFNAIYLLFLIRFQLHPATHILLHSGQAAPYTDACISLNILLQLGIAFVSGDTLDGPLLDSQCHTHGPSMLVLFTQLYAGFIIPVFVSYQLERQMKLSYIDAMRRQALGHPRRWEVVSPVWVPGVKDMLLVCGLGALAWVVVLFQYETISRMALPL